MTCDVVVLDRVVDATRVLTRLQSVPSAHQGIVDSAMTVFDAPGAALFLVEEAGFLLTAVAGCCSTLSPRMRLLPTGGALATAIAALRPTRLATADNAPAGLGAQCPALVAPLHDDKEVMALLWIPMNWSDATVVDTMPAIRLFTVQASVALQNAHGHDERAAIDDRTQTEIAMLAHEFRNPLAAIISALGVLERVGEPDGQAVELRELIRRQTKHLTRVVDDVLGLARLKHGKVRLKQQPVDLRQVVRLALDTVRVGGHAAGRDVRYNIGTRPLYVYGDATRLQQAVRNLLDNAVKYSPHGTAITVSVEEDRADAMLRVRDRGVGITSCMLARLFEPFAQADVTARRSAGGLGLGLPLVRAIVEQHGGTIAAHSDGLGRGSEFVVRLPLHLPAPSGR